MKTLEFYGFLKYKEKKRDPKLSKVMLTVGRDELEIGLKELKFF